MTGIVDWAATRARMVLAFIVLSLLVGGFAYTTLPKEGEPDIEIPMLIVSVPFPAFQPLTVKHCWLSQWKTSWPTSMV